MAAVLARAIGRRWILALASLVVVSTAIRFVAARTFTVPWVAPDEMLYALIGRSLWLHGTLTVRNAATPYYSLLYPALIGGPMLLRDTRRSIEVIQAVQALVISAAAVPVYLWARRLMDPPLAFAAAMLTLLVPTLAYSGLMMSEALFYPLAVVSLIAMARVLEEPTVSRQGQFLLALTVISAVRLQAFVLLPAFVLAAVLHAFFARSTRTLRRLAPFVGTGIVAVVGVVALRLAFGPGVSWQDVLGAYGGLGASASSASVGHAAASVLWHAADVAVLTLGLPLFATVVLVARGFRGQELEPATQSFLAVTSAYVVLLVCEVGAFAATHLGHVSERYLATAAPPLFIAYALWLGRGSPRPRVVALGSVVAVIALLALIPIRTLAPPEAPYDGFSTVPLARLVQHAETSSARFALLAAAILASAVFLLLPRRLGLLGLAGLTAGFALLSVVVTGEIARASRAEQRDAIGDGRPAWVDATGEQNVTLLDIGDRPLPAVTRTFFWNRSVVDTLRLQSVPTSFPAGAPAVTIAEDGSILDGRGTSISRHDVLAPSTLTLDGTPIAQLAAGVSKTYGLTLWRIDGPARVTTALGSGFLPNGDFINKARVVVYGCQRGSLEITLLGKSGAPIYSYVNGANRRTFELPSQATATEVIPAPAYVDGTHPCTYDFETDGLVGSTRVTYIAG
jgi:Dolichyl-phosphate-mannose-protein mannosyltransferase